jgi:electron transport complex protein RnfG
MHKKESTFKNMIMTLFLVTAIASTSLGFIYKITKNPINEARKLKKLNAIRDVLPDFDNEPSENPEKKLIDNDTLYFYRGMKNGEWVGTAVETFTDKGFGGRIRILVGFDPEGNIHDITVLEHQETPGLGDKIEKKKSYDKKTGLSWVSQFIGANPAEFKLIVKKDGGDVDAITAATITSRAFCDAVQRAYDGFLNEKKCLIQIKNNI